MRLRQTKVLFRGAAVLLAGLFVTAMAPPIYCSYQFRDGGVICNVTAAYYDDGTSDYVTSCSDGYYYEEFGLEGFEPGC